MSIMQFFKRYLLPYIIFTIALFVILNTPLTHVAKQSKTTSYSNIQLMQYQKKYTSLMDSIHTDLRKHGYVLTVDFAMVNDGKVEIFIKNLNMKKKLKPREIEEIKKIVNQLIEQQNFVRATFQIQLSNSTQPVLKAANRLSYNDLMEYIRSPLLDKGIKGFSLDYEISPKSSEVIIKFANPISENLKREIQQIGNAVLEKNNFDARMVKVVIID
ncbi:hypothetical protein CSE16_11205 [Solibacillus sp. R5-41]|uniref:hypothetical protein n=1 Tax=Solibacillus sp. R5-41 TaxID=2048654 RepID=UPI000C126A81|nr:hypothetical protein [Solibacillus sp. R5-41]ATP40572.1 hypothetical protein CSE16_11205 [Solibacillus sp. R5-41]